MYLGFVFLSVFGWSDGDEDEDKDESEAFPLSPLVPSAEGADMDRDDLLPSSFFLFFLSFTAVLPDVAEDGAKVEEGGSSIASLFPSLSLVCCFCFAFVVCDKEKKTKKSTSRNAIKKKEREKHQQPSFCFVLLLLPGQQPPKPTHEREKKRKVEVERKRDEHGPDVADKDRE